MCRVICHAQEVCPCPSSLTPALESLSRFHDPSTSSCQVSYPGGAAVSSPRGPGRIRARQLGGSARLSKGSRSSLAGVKEKPIPEILQPGQDEIGAGVEAMPVTVTPGDLKKARVIGQVWKRGLVSTYCSLVFIGHKGSLMVCRRQCAYVCLKD